MAMRYARRRRKAMDDLIKRSDAIKIMACEMYAEAQSQGYEVDSIEDFMPEAKAWMNDAPSADRPQGEWKQISPAKIYECSVCGQNVMTGDIEAYKWCHGCGCRMKGADDEVTTV